jgi:hypothetical protein
MYTECELNVSGRRPIAFMGEEIAMESNRETSEKTRFDWDAVRVFKLDPVWAAQQEKKTGKRLDPYRVGIARCTKWEGERDRYRVFYARTVPQICGIVRSHLPIFLRSIEEQLRITNSTVGALEHESSRNSMEP